MTDNLDKAKEIEQRTRDAAIAQARKPAAEPTKEQVTENGVIVCASCGDVIPEGRLAAFPKTTLCAPCKSLLE